MLRLIGFLLLTLALLGQGAAQRVHIGAQMVPVAVIGLDAASAANISDQPTMDCHGNPTGLELMQPTQAAEPCHNDVSCDGECGQCQIISAVAAILPSFTAFLQIHGQRAHAALPDFTSVTLFLDSPPPLV